jgi:hypothetical protein
MQGSVSVLIRFGKLRSDFSEAMQIDDKGNGRIILIIRVGQIQ